MQRLACCARQTEPGLARSHQGAKGIRQTNEVATMEQRKQTRAMTDAARAILDKEVGRRCDSSPLP
jgi:hypothetical protein